MVKNIPPLVLKRIKQLRKRPPINMVAFFILGITYKNYGTGNLPHPTF